MPPFYRGLDGYTFTENKYNIVMAIFFLFFAVCFRLVLSDMKKTSAATFAGCGGYGSDACRVLAPDALLDLASVAQGVRYGQLVDILQFVAEAYAAGNGRNLDVGVLSQAVHYIE